MIRGHFSILGGFIALGNYHIRIETDSLEMDNQNLNIFDEQKKKQIFEENRNDFDDICLIFSRCTLGKIESIENWSRFIDFYFDSKSFLISFWIQFKIIWFPSFFPTLAYISESESKRLGFLKRIVRSMQKLIEWWMDEWTIMMRIAYGLNRIKFWSFERWWQYWLYNEWLYLQITSSPIIN